MSKTLQEFISDVKSGGLAIPTHYIVNIAKPNIVLNTNKDGRLLEKISLYCDHAQIPGINILTQQTKIHGEIREMPYERYFDPVTLVFLVDREMKIKLFFDEWITSIQNRDTRNFAFYDDYISNKITIEIHDMKDTTHYAIELYEAYPKMIIPIDIGNSVTDFMRLQVVFVYKYWKVVELNHIAVSEDGSHGLSGIKIDSDNNNNPKYIYI